MLPTLPEKYSAYYSLAFLPVALSSLQGPEGKGLEDLVRGHGRHGIALLDANLIVDGLFDQRADRNAPQIKFARKVITQLRDGQVNGYVSVIFEDTYREIEARANLVRYPGTFYNWLTFATKHPFVFLEHDRRAPLPDGVRDVYLSTHKAAGKISNQKDLSFVAAAIKITQETELDVAIVTHDTDLTNSFMKTALGEHSVLVYDAQRFYVEMTKPVPPPKKALTPAAIQIMPGYAQASPQLQLGSNLSPRNLLGPKGSIEKTPPREIPDSAETKTA